MRFLLILILIVPLSSCVDVVGKIESEKTDVMLKQCDSLQSVYDSLTSIDITHIDNWIAQQDHKIKDIDFNLSFKLGEMVFQFRDLKRYKKNYKPALLRVGKELEVLRSQLQVLKTDISGGNGKRSRYKSQIQIEQKRAVVVSKNLAMLRNTNLEILRIFKLLEESLPAQLHLENEANAKSH